MRRVGQVVGLNARFELISFRERKGFEERHIDVGTAGTSEDIPARCSRSIVNASRCRRGLERRGVKVRVEATRVHNQFSDQVRSGVAWGTAGRNTEREPGLQRVDAVQLPASEGQVNGTGPLRTPVFAVPPRKLIERTENQAIVLVNVGAPPFIAEVGVKLRLTPIQIAAVVIEGLGPSERAEELEAASKAALILRLE